MDTTEVGAAPVASPGWYPDPASPEDPARRRWWDGTRWGHLDVWDGSAWRTFGHPGRGRSNWLWLAVVGTVVVVVGGGCAVLLLLGIGIDRALTHDLLEARFTTSAEPFHVGRRDESGPYVFEVRDGHYVITATGPDDNGALTVGEFARRAYAVDVSAVLVGRDARSTAGLGCVAGDGDGYLLEVGPDGVELVRVGGGGRDVRVLDSSATSPDPSAAHRLEMTCRRSLHPSDRSISGRIDGREVVSGTDGDPPTNGYDYAGLTFLPAGTGSSATFDDVVGHVPG